MKLGHRHRPSALIHTEAVHRDGGYVLVMFAILLIPVMLLAGFSVDVGHWYNRASDMQKAADAAALAGVVWLPDEAQARDVAIETAAKNGFDNADPDVSVTVTKSTKSPNRLQVTINARVGSFIYSAVGGEDLDMSRTAYAEYVTPVPMGSPRNYFGTGTLLRDYETSPTAFESEELYMAINSYCSDRQWGDRHTGRYVTSNICSSTSNPNDEYRPDGYELYIEAKETRTSNIEIRLWDPRHNVNSLQYSVPRPDLCTTTYTHTWPTGSETGWIVGNDRDRVYGPAQYQTRSRTNRPWQPVPPSVVEYGDSTGRFSANLYRYRAPVSSTPTTTCVPQSPGTATESAIDNYRSPSRSETYTWSLYEADDTPLNDTDNTRICQQSFATDAPFDGYSFLGSQRWNTLKTSNAAGASDCLITPAMESGKYILRVTNDSSMTITSDSSNQWGIVARYTTATGDGLCDGRTDDLCPRVYGKDAISVRAAADTSEASFFLAEIEPKHAGKLLRIELFDPGEGGDYIEIRRPSGPNSWEAVEFDYESTTSYSGDGITQLSVAGSRFNGQTVFITVDLTGYNPDSSWNNEWWKIYYRFSGAVTDRTTWSARILGDPVHLIEE